MTIGRRSAFFVGALAVLAQAVAESAAVEVRQIGGNRYSADLTRAYVECTAPNTTTSTGLPACTPAVTSACNFGSGGFDLRKREDALEINLDAFVNNVSGPGNCPTGPYTLVFNLRMSFGLDPTCTDCTAIDVPVNVPLMQHSNDFRRLDLTLESLFPGSPSPIANYEILDVVVNGPDGLPMAGVGAGEGNADVRADMSTAYDECTVPDTTNLWGLPACSAPVWQSACDFRFLQAQIESPSAGPRFEIFGEELVGPFPQCSDGTYTLVPTLRITTDDCGTPCTVVDIQPPFDVIVEDGIMDSTNMFLAFQPALAFLGEDDTVELRAITLYDPLGNLLAGQAVTPTLRFVQARFLTSFRDVLNLGDDKAVIKGSFPNPIRKEAIPNPGLDPTVGGATITATDKDGVVYSATIPAGSWEVKVPDRKWRYKDDLGTINGVRRAEIREFRHNGIRAGFKVKMLVKDANLSAADLPAINLTVQVSNAGGATEVAAHGTICKVTPKRVSCK